MTRHLLRLGLLVGLLAPLAACDSNSDDLSPGKYRAEITGAIERSLDGRATFQTDALNTEDDPSLAIVMTTAPGLRGISIIGRESQLNRPGDYTLGVEDEVFLLYTDATEEGLFFLSLSGTLTLTVVEADRVAGTFSAEITSGDEEATSQITGEFDAVFIEPAER